MELFWPFLEPMLDSMAKDISLGRFVESVVLLWIIWRKLRPHLREIEKRMAGLEQSVKTGFNSGENRFQQIEKEQAILKIKIEAMEKPRKGKLNETTGLI